MRILVVSQYFWPENFKINDLCEALIDKGHEVTVYTGLPNYPEGSLYSGYTYFNSSEESLGKIKIIRVPHFLRGKNSKIFLILNYLSFFIVASFLAPFKVKGNYDKIFAYGVSPVTVIIPAILLRFIKKAPLFFWIADLWPESLEATGMVKNKKVLKFISRIIGFFYKFVDRILVTSQGFIPRLEAAGVKSEKIEYLPQWAEDIFNQPTDDSFSDKRIPDSGFKVMFAGNIGISQDFQTVVEAAKKLIDHKEIYFLILGDGLMSNWAKNEVQKNKMENNFIFLGKKPLNQMPDYYQKADVMLLSLMDTDLFSITVPAKLQSYMATGKPIMASINGEGAELVELAQAGIVVPASSPELLAEGILKLSQVNKIELEQMGKNAKIFYNENFDRQVLINKLLKILNDQKLNF